jgi:hypothetical protein
MKEHKRKAELPVSEADTAIFVSWLIENRKVKAGTINGYLAGIRQMHVMKGVEPPQIRSSSRKLILKGKRMQKTQKAGSEEIRREFQLQ